MIGPTAFVSRARHHEASGRGDRAPCQQKSAAALSRLAESCPFELARVNVLQGGHTAEPADHRPSSPISERAYKTELESTTIGARGATVIAPERVHAPALERPLYVPFKVESLGLSRPDTNGKRHVAIVERVR